jgi:hypothetical protein
MWRPIADAPPRKTVWVVDMTSNTPTAYLASFSRTQMNKVLAWRIVDGRAQMVAPTHFHEVEAPALPEK